MPLVTPMMFRCAFDRPARRLPRFHAPPARPDPFSSAAALMLIFRLFFFAFPMPLLITPLSLYDIFTPSADFFRFRRQFDAISFTPPGRLFFAARPPFTRLVCRLVADADTARCLARWR